MKETSSKVLKTGLAVALVAGMSVPADVCMLVLEKVRLKKYLTR